MRFSLIIFLFLSINCNAQFDSRFEIRTRPGSNLLIAPQQEELIVYQGKVVSFYEAQTGYVKAEIKTNAGSITSLSINKSGTYMLTGHKDGALKLWDYVSRKLVMDLIGHEKAVLGGVFVDDSSFVSAGKDNELKFWTVSNYLPHDDIASNVELTGEIYSTRSGIYYGSAGEIITFRYKYNYDSVRVMNPGVGSIERMVLRPGTNEAVVVGKTGKMNYLNLETGNLIKSLSMHKGNIRSIKYCSDREHVLVSGASSYLLNPTTGQKIFDYNKVSSPIIDSEISYNGNLVYISEETSQKIQVIDIGSLGLKPAVFLRDDSDKTPPQIYLASPAKIIDNRVVHYESLLPIRGSVIDDFGVQLLKINGITTPVKANGNFLINVPLTMGDNMITIEVTDINQNTSLKKFIVNRKNIDGSDYDPAEATNYLIVIGINKYKYWPQLYNAVKDANDVVSTLLGMYNFEFANVTLITDEQATRSNIYNKLREYVNKVGPKDNFMIYYSGHGYFDELLNEGYWVPADARIDQTGDYLSNSDISKIIANIDSQHTFLVADACFSGSLFNESSRGYAENVEKFKSRWGLASGRLETVSDGEVGANSPFAKSFITYLKTNEKEKIAVSQLVQFVKLEVSEVSSQTPIGNPLRGVGDEGGEFIFYKKND